MFCTDWQLGRQQFFKCEPRSPVTVKEQYNFLLQLAHECNGKVSGDHRARQLLECAATLQDLWMDMETELILDFTDNQVPTVKSIQKISTDYCRSSRKDDFSR
jgi:hypothetical protein